MYMIHLRTDVDVDLVVFCKDPVEERTTLEYKDYKAQGYKEVSTFDLTLVKGDEDLPYSIENV